MDTVHLIIDHRENRRLLAEALAGRYRTTVAESGQELKAPFDLAVVDGPAFSRISGRIGARKAAEATFLPFLLVSPHPGIEMAAGHLWREVDEVLATPIRKLELLARVEMLLRARRFSREAEERYFSLAAISPLAVLILQEERIVWANTAFAALLAEPPEVVGREGLLASLHPAERQGVIELWQALLEGRPAVQPVTARLAQDGAMRWLEVYASAVEYRSRPALLVIAADVTARMQAEEALRESERSRIELQTELTLAAWVQSRLLPDRFPDLDAFDIAASCLPARQVGGDFYDWDETTPGVLSLTLGDVMGHGLGAAMLMATVRATLRAVAQQSTPLQAVQQAERALHRDLENSESFVTLFHARLDVASRRLTYVDCGHGYEFLRHTHGSVETLRLRGTPMGIPRRTRYREGTFIFHHGDTLVLYSDGLIETHPELRLTPVRLAQAIEGTATSREAVDRLLSLAAAGAPPSDDVTVMVLRCCPQKMAKK